MTIERDRKKIVAAVLHATEELNRLTNKAIERGLSTTLDVDNDGEVYIDHIDRVYYKRKKEEE